MTSGLITGLHIFVVGMAMLAIQGCVFVPTTKHMSDSAYGTRAVLSEKTIDDIKVGEATRADVLLMLGSPTTRYQNDRFFLYEGMVTHGYLIMGGGYWSDAGGVKINHLLCIEFTKSNRVARIDRFDEYWTYDGPRNRKKCMGN